MEIFSKPASLFKVEYSFVFCCVVIYFHLTILKTRKHTSATLRKNIFITFILNIWALTREIPEWIFLEERFLKRGPLLMERTCSPWEQILSFYSRPHFRCLVPLGSKFFPFRVDPISGLWCPLGANSFL